MDYISVSDSEGGRGKRKEGEKGAKKKGRKKGRKQKNRSWLGGAFLNVNLPWYPPLASAPILTGGED